MSFYRSIYYFSVIGGWAAFVAWLIAELSILRFLPDGRTQAVVAGALIGAAVAAGLNVVAGMANRQLKQLLSRLILGAVGGGIGGAVGSFFGDVMYMSIGFPRVVGWMVMGMGIGVVEGLSERSPRKIRNGLLGGGLGGLAGGILFDLIPKLINSSGISSRATAFVVLGLCIGAMIGLAQVVLKEAWLTVVEGYRVGRQLILSQPVTVLGRGDHLPLPFLGMSNADVDFEHLRILREANSSYFVEDMGGKLGTQLNGQKLQGKTPLKNDDVLKFGPNFVRFNEKRRGAAGPADPTGPGGTISNQGAKMAPPPPPVKSAPPPPRPVTQKTPPQQSAPVSASIPRTTPIPPAPSTAPAPSAPKVPLAPPPPPPPRRGPT